MTGVVLLLLALTFGGKKQRLDDGRTTTRERRVVLIIGAQGTGKTTLARTLYGRAMQRGERVVVYDPNDPSRGIWPNDLDADLARRLQYRSVDMISLDDIDTHLRPWALSRPGPWRDVALRNRHVGVDVVLTARSVSALPPELLSAVDVLYVFQVSALSSSERRRLLEVAPTLAVPSEPFRFAAVEPKRTAIVRYGRTLASGGFSFD